MSHINIIDSDGSVVNTIVASAEFAEANYPGMWVIADVQPSLDSASDVPKSVTAFQAKAALLQAGLLDEVEALMAHEDTPRIIVLAWEEALTFERNSPTVGAMADAIGLDDSALDALFVTASSITA